MGQTVLLPQLSLKLAFFLYVKITEHREESWHIALFHPVYTVKTRTSWAYLHWNCFKRLVYISEQDVQIFLGVVKIMCHIFCTLLRNSVSEEKGWIFNNAMFGGLFFEAEILNKICQWCRKGYICY